MTQVFVDTSALYALLDVDDESHSRAVEWLAGVPQSDFSLLTHNYCLVETSALVQRRLSMSHQRTFVGAIVPLLDIRYIDEAIHLRGQAAFMASLRRKVSFVDSVSFEMMSQQRISEAFCFDRHFVDAGFGVLP